MLFLESGLLGNPSLGWAERIAVVAPTESVAAARFDFSRPEHASKVNKLSI